MGRGKTRERVPLSPQAEAVPSGLCPDAVAGMAGLEPANAGVKVPCLTTWLHPNVEVWPGPERTPRLWPQYGVGNGARTHDTRNHNPVLCQLSYTHHIQFWRWRIRLKLGKETRRSERTLPSAGGRAMRGLRRRRGTPEGTRTPGPLLRRQLLYPPELQAHILRFAGTPQKRPSVSARDKDCGKADGLSRLRRSERYAACAGVERVMGIEPTRPAWKAGILPLNYTRVMGASANISFAMIAQSLRLCQSLP